MRNERGHSKKLASFSLLAGQAQRIFGFVHPQVSGMYKFAITSDDTSELWLRNEDPASSKMIARVYSAHGSAWTVEGDYKKYPDQISKEILLHAGKKYYIESLSKQGLVPLMLLYTGLITGMQHLKLFPRNTCQVFMRVTIKN